MLKPSLGPVLTDNRRKILERAILLAANINPIKISIQVQESINQ